jgi:hypothetical protein
MTFSRPYSLDFQSKQKKEGAVKEERRRERKKDNPFSNTPADFCSLSYKRWSIAFPVPQLGNEKTPWNEVDKFYKFWYRFKSWRDYSYDVRDLCCVEAKKKSISIVLTSLLLHFTTPQDEFDLNEADSRDEKRWMDKQNEKVRQKKKKDEAARILKLVGKSKRT